MVVEVKLLYGETDFLLVGQSFWANWSIEAVWMSCLVRLEEVYEEKFVSYHSLRTKGRVDL